MTYRLRLGTEHDREWLWRLHCETMRPYVDATWGWNDGDQRERFDEAFDPRRVEIVVIGNEPVGMLRVQRRPDEVVLAALQVAPSWQGRGIGAALVSAVIEEAGGRPVTLQVLKVNPARALYERMGFVVEGESTTHVVMRRPRTRTGTRRGA